MQSPRILIVDDDASFREVLRFQLEEAGYAVEAEASGEAALERFTAEPFPVVVTDLKMPGLDGQALMEALHAQAPNTLVIMITAFGDLQTAVRAMKSGAFDFIPKPFDREQLRLILRRAVAHAGLRREVDALQARLGSEGKPLLYRSAAMQQVVALVDRVAATEATVLVQGESGTGKELLARRIHRGSARREGPWVAVNCGAIPQELLEDELFGHVRGAFTGATRARKGRFQQADGGTIFLDEVGELPLALQTRLLRVLQERLVDVVGSDAPVPVDLRVVAATNRDLDALVAAGEFREDLYYRLNVVPVYVPALRERLEDLPLLLEYFLRRASDGASWEIPTEALAQLQRLPWRGNVREVENLCQRLAVMSDGHVVDATLLPAAPAETPNEDTFVSPARIELPPGGVALAELERSIVVKALELCDYNQSRAAKFLRIPRHVLIYRIEKYAIPMPGKES